MRHRLASRALAAVVLGQATAALATDHSFSTTVALDPTAFGSGGYAQFLSGYPVIELQSGDRLTGAVSFADGVAISVKGGFLWLEVGFFGNAGTDFTGTVTLTGLTGSHAFPNPYTMPPHLLGNAVVAALVMAHDDPTQDFSFTGFSYELSVLAITPRGATTSGAVPFSLGVVSVEAGSVALVPEPAPGALLAAGLAALAWRGRPRATGRGRQRTRPVERGAAGADAGRDGTRP